MRIAHLLAFKCSSHPFAQTQTCDQGVVVSAAGDWGLDLATYPMTIMIGQQVRNFNANPHKWDDKTLTTRGNVSFGFQRVQGEEVWRQQLLASGLPRQGPGDKNVQG